MEDEIVKVIYDKYSIKVDSVERIKNVYKIYSNKIPYCLKVIKYEFKHFNFILSAIIHIKNRGYENTPDIIKNNSGEYYIKLYDNYCYLTTWIDGVTSDFTNIYLLDDIAVELGRLHKYSLGFSINKNMNPRIYWFSWINTFNTRKNEIIDFQKRISQKCFKDKFDKLYLKYIDEEVEKARVCVNCLENSNYKEYMEREVYKRGFCHHDLANHNIMVKKDGDINFIDFDYCILDTATHDLASFILRALNKNNWNIEIAERIFDKYSTSNPINKNEIKFLRWFIEFPQPFWQIGLQRYWEQKMDTESQYIKKMEGYLSIREKKQSIAKEFFNNI